ncbi:hypothetical protein [Chryseobacterium sp. MEBOG07]|uniref:hypothetical protein n=1 Tax=Chryseobacterium sp. MEBOG07 TaxID=2879939 RepID=UPI001F34FE8F|nr:hypothetical protein [Chryseobacterium sp. MEBOG07]UKB81267.1 hypothetical protein LF886_09830 [Chryseobacterium sp. MEBOG07]
MNITRASSWKDLNKWQLEEVVELYLHLTEENYKSTLKQFVTLILQEKKGFFSRIKYRSLKRKAPISSFYKYVKFLLDPPNLYSFPDLPGLKKPTDKMTDLTIKQYGIMDQFFHAWITTKNDNFLKALVASIYRIDSSFDEENITLISERVNKLTKKERQVIGFIYMSCNHYIGDSFPDVFPKVKESEKKKKKIPNPFKHKPFSEVIINVAMHEQQPLGNLHESNKTKIFEFMNVLTKIVINQERLRKEYEKSK